MKKIILSFAAALAFYACQNSSSNANTASNTASTPSAATTTQPAANNTAPAKVVKAERELGEKNILGKLIEVMDMDYPRAFLTIQDGKNKVSANFNEEGEEGKRFKVAELSKWKKRQVNVFYMEKMNSSVIDIQANGVSILEGGNAEVLPEYKKLNGTLIAAETTKGDLPTILSLKTADGTVYEFEYFITDKEVAQNGKTVEIIYTEVQNNELISIETLD